MYKCKVCSEVSQPGERMRKHVLYRSFGPLKGTILREIPVCQGCQEALNILGVSLDRLTAAHLRNGRVVIPPIPMPVYHGRDAKRA